MESWLALGLIVAGAGSLFAGLLCLGASAYLFARKKGLSMGPMPVWAVALGAGLLLTFVVPGALAFILMQAILAPPPAVTCYEVQPQVMCYKVSASVAMTAVPVAMRLELADKLMESGRLPDHIYRKIRK
jgi:hypothetical protein